MLNIIPVIYSIQLLENEDIYPFLYNFYSAIAQNLVSSEPANWVNRKVLNITKKLNLNYNLLLFCKKPLIMAFLAVLGLDSKTEGFPNTEKEIFGIFIERFITNYEFKHSDLSRNGFLPDVTNEVESKEILLWGFYQISYYLFMAKFNSASGTSVTQIEQNISEKYSRLAKVNPFRAKGTAKGIINFWERTGLFERAIMENTEKLSSVFSVLEEYGASKAIILESEMNEDNFWSIIEPYIFSSSMSNVLAMALTEFKEENFIVKRFIEEEKKTNSLHLPVLTVAKAISYGLTVPIEIKQEIVNRLCELVKKDHNRSTSKEALTLLVQLNEIECLTKISQDPGISNEIRNRAIDYLYYSGNSNQTIASLLIAYSQNSKYFAFSQNTIDIAGLALLYASNLLFISESELDESESEYTELFVLPPSNYQEEVIDILLFLGNYLTLDFGLAQRIIRVFGYMNQIDALLQFSKNGIGKKCFLGIAAELSKLNDIDDAIELWFSILIDPNRSIYEQISAANEILSNVDRLRRRQLQILQSINNNLSIHYRVREIIERIIIKSASIDFN